MVSSASRDGHEYYALATVAGSAIRATPPSSIDAQHREALRLLLHVQQNVGALEGGVAGKGARKPANMVPLVRKNADKALSHRLLLLWLLKSISESILVPDNLSDSKSGIRSYKTH